MMDSHPGACPARQNHDRAETQTCVTLMLLWCRSVAHVMLFEADVMLMWCCCDADVMLVWCSLKLMWCCCDSGCHVDVMLIWSWCNADVCCCRMEMIRMLMVFRGGRGISCLSQAEAKVTQKVSHLMRDIGSTHLWTRMTSLFMSHLQWVSICLSVCLPPPHTHIYVCIYTYIHTYTA